MLKSLSINLFITHLQTFYEQAALANAEEMSWFMQWGLYETITALESQAFITRTAGELLFDGYDDTLLSMADMFASSADRPLDKFAWFYKVRFFLRSKSDGIHFKVTPKIT